MTNKNFFSTKIDIKLKDKLKQDLEKQGFLFKTPKYTIFSAQKKGVVCTLYESGSLLVQGKQKDEFIEFYLEPIILKSFHYSNPLFYIDQTPRIGVDESGKGDFFGPLSVVSLFADKNGISTLVDLNVQDSKKIPDEQILKLKNKIIKKFDYSLVILYPQKYNELYNKIKNLNYLLAWAHSTAIHNLYTKTKCKNVLIDQFAKKSLVSSYVNKKNIKINLKQEHKAENDVVVAAASILARAFFLEGLNKLSKEIDLKLLKGASSKVKTLGKKIYKSKGIEILKKVSKTHFKTFKEILEED